MQGTTTKKDSNDDGSSDDAPPQKTSAKKVTSAKVAAKTPTMKKLDAHTDVYDNVCRRVIVCADICADVW